MARIASDITRLIGGTPLVDVSPILGDGAAPHRILAKLEAWSPTGSNKDRAVLAMIRDAERQGFLRRDGTIVECSGGDLALSIALVGRARGYRVVLTMPECMKANRCSMLRALGAEVVFTSPEEGIRGAMDRAESMAKEIDGGLCLQPFSNRANSLAHENTAREIWEDTDGRLAAVVCPVGTGGTISGVARWFHEHEPQVAVYGVEPASSAVIGGAAPGPHNIPGLGAGFVPDIFDPTHVTEILPVRDDEALGTLRRLVGAAHILAGPASGAVLHAAVRLAGAPDGALDGAIVAVLPDAGERYVEHPAYQELGGEQPAGTTP